MGQRCGEVERDEERGEREREEREGKHVTVPVRCGCVTSRAERGNVMGKFNIEDVDWRLL